MLCNHIGFPKLYLYQTLTHAWPSSAYNLQSSCAKSILPCQITHEASIMNVCDSVM